jgi:hypothetical protein
LPVTCRLSVYHQYRTRKSNLQVDRFRLPQAAFLLRNCASLMSIALAHSPVAIMTLRPKVPRTILKAIPAGATDWMPARRQLSFLAFSSSSILIWRETLPQLALTASISRIRMGATHALSIIVVLTRARLTKRNALPPPGTGYPTDKHQY